MKYPWINFHFQLLILGLFKIEIYKVNLGTYAKTLDIIGFCSNMLCWLSILLFYVATNALEVQKYSSLDM